ncbi:MAG: type II toxin-antitoxin system RatA family toxin [Gammaproteobacteria bacterium]
MRTVRRSAQVPFSAEQMFDLVDDITSYPEFLPWCQSATVQRRTEDLAEATLEVGVAGVKKQFSTRNRLDRPHRIEIQLLKGPFRLLEGAWTFDDHDEGGSGVGLILNFEVTASPLKMVFGVLFEEIVRSQVTAFTDRAKEKYG